MFLLQELPFRLLGIKTYPKRGIMGNGGGGGLSAVKVLVEPRAGFGHPWDRTEGSMKPLGCKTSQLEFNSFQMLTQFFEEKLF